MHIKKNLTIAALSILLATPIAGVANASSVEPSLTHSEMTRLTNAKPVPGTSVGGQKATLWGDNQDTAEYNGHTLLIGPDGGILKIDGHKATNAEVQALFSGHTKNTLNNKNSQTNTNNNQKNNKLVQTGQNNNVVKAGIVGVIAATFTAVFAAISKYFKRA